jgi:hypothetical protein
VIASCCGAFSPSSNPAAIQHSDSFFQNAVIVAKNGQKSRAQVHHTGGGNGVVLLFTREVA